MQTIIVYNMIILLNYDGENGKWYVFLFVAMRMTIIRVDKNQLHPKLISNYYGNRSDFTNNQHHMLTSTYIYAYRYEF